MVQLTDKHWVLEVPSMAFGLMVNNYGNESELMYMLSMEDIADEPNHEETLITKKLPPGNYQFLFTTKEATWEQAESVVEKINGWYKNYEGDVLYSNPVDSLQSLLKAKSCDLNKNWAIIQTTTNE